VGTALLSLVVASLLCGDQVSLPEKVFKSARIVEFTLTYDAAKKPVPLGRVIFPAESTEPAPPLGLWLTSNSPCAPLALKKKQVRLLAFFDANGKQLVGVEQDQGQGTDLDPTYASLVEAALEAKGWPDERMRAVGPEQLWQPQKKALQSDNPYLRRLAAVFLYSHDASDVVDAAWGAKGSAERRTNEARAANLDASFCPRPKVKR
jgi:hypothetical protein